MKALEIKGRSRNLPDSWPSERQETALNRQFNRQ